MEDSRDQTALYLVAVRAPIGPDGSNHNQIMKAIEQTLNASIPLRSDDVEMGASVILYSELTANHNGYLREFGFSFDLANRLITVADTKDN